MATWIAHIRIAEHFIKNYNILNNSDFLVGNIAPDSGVPNEDWSKFTPDTKISHWMSDDKNINSEKFRKIYINKISDNLGFYIGYYFHLLTDIEWGKLYDKKLLEPIYYNGLNKDEKFIWTIKKDWYGQDRLYLKNNPSSLFFTMFSKIKVFENKYLDIFSKDAFIEKIKYITNYYMNGNENIDRDYIYLCKEEMDLFVKNTINYLEQIYFEIIKNE